MIQLLENAINKIKHPYYDRTNEVARYWTSMVTGTYQEEYIVSYKQRETEGQKEQRIHLYNPRTKDVAGSSIAIFDKVDNADPIAETVLFPNDSEQLNKSKVSDIDINISKFKDGESLKKWLSENYQNFNATDPNAWAIFTYYMDNGVIKTTADIMPSSSIIDFSYEFGDLQYLVTKEEKQVASRKGGSITTIDCYYIYTKDVIYIYEELKDVMYDYGDAVKVKVSGKNEAFMSSEYQNLGDRVPAIRLGYNPDVFTNNKTFVSMLDKSEFLFKELINRKSEFDLSLALHTFLQKFQIAEPCDFNDPEEKDHCDGGTMSRSGATCTKCKGTGLKIHTTSQDIILVKAPTAESAQEGQPFVGLQDRVHYPSLPFDIVNKQDELIDKYAKLVGVSIFGVDISERENPNVTATAISNYYDSINHVLSAYAYGKSAIYRFAVEQISINKGYGLPVVRYEYSDQFDILTLQEMFTMLKSAKESGAAYSTIQAMQDDITAKQNQGNPLVIEAVRIREQFKPFKGLSADERKMHLAALSEYDRNKIAYLYNDLIFDRIQASIDISNFLMMPYDKQLELVNDQVAVIVDDMKTDSSMNTSQVMRSAVTRDTAIDEADEDIIDDDVIG